MKKMNSSVAGVSNMHAINSLEDLDKAFEVGPYAWPGGYPTYFITHDGQALSYEAALADRELIEDAIRAYQDSGGSDDWLVVALEINWEDPDLFCSHTGERIMSAYSEPEEAAEKTS